MATLLRVSWAPTAATGLYVIPVLATTLPCRWLKACTRSPFSSTRMLTILYLLLILKSNRLADTLKVSSPLSFFLLLAPFWLHYVLGRSSSSSASSILPSVDYIGILHPFLSLSERALLAIISFVLAILLSIIAWVRSSSNYYLVLIFGKNSRYRKSRWPNFSMKSSYSESIEEESEYSEAFS